MENQSTRPPTISSSNPGNQKLWLGIVIGSLLTVIIVLIWQGYLQVTTSFLMGVAITIFALILLGVLGLYFYRDRLMKKWFGRDVDVDNVVEDLQKGIQTISAVVIDVALVGVDKEKKTT